MRRIAALFVVLVGCASEPPPQHPLRPSHVAPDVSFATSETPPPPCRCPDADCDPRLCTPK